MQYWIKAVNDGIIRKYLLPLEYWSSYGGDKSPAASKLMLMWAAPITISGIAISFFADQRAGATVGVALPKEWHLERTGWGRRVGESTSGLWDNSQ